jgi:CheY-like chemotaxis protein
MLLGAGMTVRTVHSGVAALEALADGGFDVVLMDWLMPGMDGLETTRRMRTGNAGAAAQALPVIGMTAHAFAEDRAACLQAGMDEVLVKPVSRVQLLRAIQRAVDARERT